MAAGAGAAAAWGWFEAGWVRLRTIDVRVAGLPAELEGLRIVHLSDLHLGYVSRSRKAVERAADWAETRAAEIVAVTGDLVARPRGAGELRRLLERFSRCYAVLGNQDVEHTRDPFARPTELAGLEQLLLDDARTLELRGRRIQVVGVDPRSYRGGRSHPERLADDNADLRILLCHFPYVLDRPATASAFHVVLAGHMHDGQITIPYGAGKVRLAHLSARYTSGLYERDGCVMHVSPGLGTTFVPFRFFARPEATELVLQPAS